MFNSQIVNIAWLTRLNLETLVGLVSSISDLIWEIGSSISCLFFLPVHVVIPAAIQCLVFTSNIENSYIRVVNRF